MVVSYIPVNNLSCERKAQIDAVHVEYKLVHSVTSLLKVLLTRRAKVIDIWYPHHVVFALIAFFMGIKIVYSPVLCNLEWFYVRKMLERPIYKYDLRRLRYLICDMILVNLSKVIFIQDRSFFPYWKKICFFKPEDRIKELTNNFSSNALTTYYEKDAKQAIIVGHSAEHKYYKLNSMLDELGEFSVTWVGNVSVRVMKMFPNIDFVKRLDRKNLDKLYSQSSLLIVPSIYEGSPRVVYEAMSFGCKVYAQDLNGLKKLRRIFPDSFVSLPQEILSDTQLGVCECSISMWNKISVNRKSKALRALL